VITSSIEIDRPQKEVFSYLDELDKHGEWQESLSGARVVTEGPVGVGTKVVETRKVPGGARDVTYEITAHDPPRQSSWKGLDGPIRPVGTVTVEPLGESRSRVQVEFDLEGHGIGKLFAPFVRAQARKQVPADQAKLKQILEERGQPNGG
jgi:uncharacterized membrane protein